LKDFMSEFSADGFPDPNWDDREELIWSETHWQTYLRLRRQELGHFLALYEELRHRPDRIDEVARQMGWDREDWSVVDDEEAVEEETEPEAEDLEPYTLHKHPVYIFTHGLYQAINHRLNQITRKLPQALTAEFAIQLSHVLHRGESNAILAIQSQDLGDYALTVCHLKNALSTLNDAFRLLQAVPVKRYPKLNDFCHDATRRLFDLREIWLRVMQDCRIEIERRRESGEA
jgi:hypothetical protein